MNTYIIHDARLVADPKRLNLGGKDACEIRVADNPMRKETSKGKKIPSRFVTILAWEGQANLMAKLSKSDVISVAGELGVEEYTDKEGATVHKDVMRVTNFKVHKSESFWAAGGTPEPTADEADDALPF
jgi:single-stranded DNA-binding protein